MRQLYLSHTLLPTIQYEKFNRALCLLNPYQVRYSIGKLCATPVNLVHVDMFLNFPVMDMNRNAMWRNEERPNQEGIDSNRSDFGATKHGRKLPYAESPQF